MPITYTALTAAATIVVSWRAIGPDGGGNYQYNSRRGFLSFDLTSEGISPGSIETAELILVCSSIVGGGDTIRLSSATGGSGWGATLDSSQADYISTGTFDESDLAVNSTGTKTWAIDPDHIDATGVTYFRLKNLSEGQPSPFSTAANFASQDNGTAANRPILRLTLFTGQVIFVNAA